MFTGLVEEIGTVSVFRSAGEGREIAIAAPGLTANDLNPGDSVSASGACLTVERIEPGRFWARIMPQTAKMTTLENAPVGRRVNLERALKVGDRLGGHFVLGHVDGIAVVTRFQRRGDSALLEVEFPPHLSKFIVSQGSVSLDGVSLTIVETKANRLRVSLVKETLERTTLGQAQVGDELNFEVDILARHIAALLEEKKISESAAVKDVKAQIREEV